MRKYTLPEVLAGTIDSIEDGIIVSYKINGIQIPMLQRDYAQGRQEQEGMLKRFLDAIFKSLADSEPLELDFVYGSIEQLDSGFHFIPLDGQQRLTMLFLLYWYIGKRELMDTNLTDLLKLLSRFSYSTRVSAREFCLKLCSSDINITEHPSKEILQSTWFYGIYKQDPTVASMLVVLDAIHVRYNDSNGNIYPNLSKMGFYILPLKNFG